ncbi:hypothetical protein GCM10010174_61630 [Kutzneria viridogrisea]
MTFRFLVSYHYHRDTDLTKITDAYPGRCEVFADSGAFSAYTTGARIDLADYAAWLRHWQGLITTASTLDVIGDSAATERNTIRLEGMGLRVLPVFHTGSPWGRLEHLCARYPYVALGGMVPYSRRAPEVMRWLIRCFRTAQDHGTVFHGFGLTRVESLRALPFYSVDSSSWAAGARYGSLNLWDNSRARIVQVRTGVPSEARRHSKLISAHGANPVVVGRPGFAVLSRRTPAEFAAEIAQMRGVPALAYSRLGECLQARHRVPAPNGWTEAGTVLYLADAVASHLVDAARAITTDQPLCAAAHTTSTGQEVPRAPESGLRTRARRGSRHASEQSS